MYALTLVIGAAWAATVEYPLMAEITFTPDGVSRFSVPPELRSSEDPDDQSDLLLIDGNGQRVPVAWMRGEGGEQILSPALDAGLEVRPIRGDAFQVTVSERPVDALRISLEEGPAAIEYTLESVDGRPVSGPHLIWRVGRAEQALVPLPPTTGTWILRGTVVHGDRTELPRNILAVRRSAVHVPPVQLTVDVSQQALTEDGYAWYELALPSPLPVRRVRVQATDDVFQRQAHLIAAPEQPWEEYEITGRMGEPTELIRVAIAGSWLDDTWLPLSGMPSDLLRLYVRTQDEVPLDIPSVLIELEGLDGLVRDPGPGPHRLYGGAPVGTTTQSELQVAAPELARLASRTAAVGAVQANPEHEPPEVRAGLVDPVGVISTRGFRWRAPVTGGPGLVRIPLTEEVLAHAREELHDLRLIDAEGRQIPSFTRRRNAPEVWTALPFERTEDGSTSLIELSLPATDLTLSSITLHTSAELFQRRITVGVPGGGAVQPIRYATWWGASRPGSLTLRLDQRVADKLIVEIDNADNHPLPIEAIDVARPRWELVAWLPEGEVTLLYDHRRIDAPSYDLTLLRASVERRATREATLGPGEPITLGTLSGTDRVAVYGGLLVLIVGLGAVVLQLLRTPPAGSQEPSDADAA